MKLHNLIILSVAMFSCFLLSCRREKDLYKQAVPELVKVVSGADIAFKAIGGEGDIVLEETGTPVTVTTQQSDWCHLTVDGNTIHVAVDEHVGLESRYAVLNIASGEKTGKTIVHQYGIIVRKFNGKDITLTNEAREIVYEYDANETLLKAESDVDWVHLTIEPESFTINIDENPDVTESREGHINWNIGNMNGIITVFQFDPESAEMLGDYTLKFLNGKSVKLTTVCTLSATADGTYQVTVADSKLGLNMAFNTVFDKMNPTFPIGEKWGTYATKTATYNMYCLLSNSATNLAYGTAVNTGSFPMVMAKNTTGKWVGTSDLTASGNQYFHLEGWTDDNHEGVSGVSLSYTSIQMTKK